MRKLTKRQKILLSIVIIAVVITSSLIVGISYYAAHELSYPDREKITSTPADYGIPYENVSFTTTDGVVIKGWFIPSNGLNKSRANATVILLHGYTHSRMQMIPYMEFIYPLGYNILMFDFRAHGETKGGICTVGYHEPRDVAAAMDWLSHRRGVDVNRTAILGLSLGAATAIIYASTDPRVKVLIPDSPFANADRVAKRSFTYFSGFPEWPFGPITVFFMEQNIHAKAAEISPEKSASRLSPEVHMLIIEGEKDSIAGPEDGRMINSSAGCHSTLWIVPGTEHVKALETHPDEYKKRVSDFLIENL